MTQFTAVPAIRGPPFLTPLLRSNPRKLSPLLALNRRRSSYRLHSLLRGVAASVGKEETELSVSSIEKEEETDPCVSPAGEEQESEQLTSGENWEGASPEDMENIRQIQRVLKLLKENRDMTFGEVKLTIMIEDPRDIERKRLLGIEDPDELTRDDLASALEDVHEGRIPENRDALQLLAKEMSEWPDLEVEGPKKKSQPSKSPYAKATDIGVDVETAAKRLNIDWDSAANIDQDEETDELEVPPAVGYGALYLVTAFPIIIGISVVLILFYNSLQ